MMVCSDGVEDSLCGVMQEAGQGIGVFLSKVDAPFLMVAIILFSVFIVVALVALITRAIAKARNL
jgi:hypothetical protein